MKFNNKFMFWLPRICCILSILFISLFALDSFTKEKPLKIQVVDMMIHLIPTFILLLILILAWKKEFIGGIILLLISILFAPIIYIQNYNINHSLEKSVFVVFIINLPFFLSGFLFILSHNYKKNKMT